MTETREIYVRRCGKDVKVLSIHNDGTVKLITYNGIFKSREINPIITTGQNQTIVVEYGKDNARSSIPFSKIAIGSDPYWEQIC